MFLALLRKILQFDGRDEIIKLIFIKIKINRQDDIEG